MRRPALVIDVRPMADYSAAHIPGSISNTLRGVYPTWLGWLVPRDTPILFVTGDAPIDQVIDESLLLGHARSLGCLACGVASLMCSVRSVHVAYLVAAAHALI